jgi:hypothetical protein
MVELIKKKLSSNQWNENFPWNNKKSTKMNELNEIKMNVK